MSSAAGTFQDKTLNKVALCSAVFAGFAYVGYSYAKTAFSGRPNRKLEDEDDTSGLSHVILRRLSQTTQTDSLMGNMDFKGDRGKLFLKPKTVQERIKELNQRAQYFSDAFMAIQTGHESSTAVTRSRAMAAKSVQCSPWHSPRVLSPVDVRHLMTSQSTDNLTYIPQSSPVRWKRRSLRRKKTSDLEEEANKMRLEKEAMELCQKQSEVDKKICETKGMLLSPYEAKSLVAMLYSEDKALVERTLVTIANCSAFSVNLDFLRESGCIHRLCDLLQTESLRLPAVQTLGNVILSEENIRQAKDCLPHLMNFVLDDNASNTGLRLASLIVLTNIAATTDWHDQFNTIISKLYELVDNCGTHVQMQSLRLLVNLSCNKNMAESLLNVQGPKRLSNLLSMTTADPVLLRVLTLLNALVKMARQLPTQDYDQSTMYARLLHDNQLLVNQAKEIYTNHRNSEIRDSAQRLYNSLQQ